MKPISILAALASLSPALAAQVETSPAGWLNKEGAWNHSSLLGYYNATGGSAYCTIDPTQIGQGRTIQKLSLRRDGETATNVDFVARKTKVTIRLGHATTDQLGFGAPQPDSVYLQGAWSVVFDQQVSLPDLSLQPSNGPAPFNVQFPLTQQFVYDGKLALVIQLQSGPGDQAKNAARYPLDQTYTKPYVEGPVAYYGKGCVASGRTKPFDHYVNMSNYGPKFTDRVTFYSYEAPAGAPVVILAGTKTDLPIGACANLLVAPVVMPSMVADANGYAYLEWRFPHQAAYVGIKLAVQLAALDAAQPGLPFALTGGSETTFPADPVLPQEYYTGGRAWSNQGWPDFNFGRGSAVIFGIN